MGRRSFVDNKAGNRRAAAMAVRQKAMPIGCISGTKRTRMAAVLMAAMDAISTNETRGFSMSPLGTGVVGGLW